MKVMNDENNVIDLRQSMKDEATTEFIGTSDPNIFPPSVNAE